MSFPNKRYSDIASFLKDYSSQLQKGYESVFEQDFESISNEITRVIKDKDKIITCGNGGSTAISEHFVCDFMKGVSFNTNLQPIVLSLSSNVPSLTAIANDLSYEEVFSFQLKSYGTKDDVLICVSSSGNSPNIISALKQAKKIGMQTISLVGFDGGEAKKMSDYCLHVAVNNYGIVEDIHQGLMHILAQYIRLKFFENDEIESFKF